MKIQSWFIKFSKINFYQHKNSKLQLILLGSTQKGLESQGRVA